MATKQYIIGRGMDCDIVLKDATDVVSRKHAVLVVTSTGKMTITDKSRNGTYINNIKINPGEPVEVSRKDVVDFAHSSVLDWKQVPSSNMWLKIGGFALAILVIAAAVFFGVKKCNVEPEGGVPTVADTTQIVAPVDSVAIKDSIKRAETDSIIKAQGAEIERLKHESSKPKTNTKKEEVVKKAEHAKDSASKKEPEPAQTIGL